jgi:hypothetical protein
MALWNSGWALCMPWAAYPRHVRLLVHAPVVEVPAAVVVALIGGERHGGVATGQHGARDACSSARQQRRAWAGALLAGDRCGGCKVVRKRNVLLCCCVLASAVRRPPPLCQRWSACHVQYSKMLAARCLAPDSG